MKYRCKIDLAADVLSAVLKVQKKTHIMYSCNMNCKQLYSYLSMLIKSGMLSFSPVTDCYAVTEQGEKFLELFKVYKEHFVQAEKKLAVVREERGQLDSMCSSMCESKDEQFLVES